MSDADTLVDVAGKLEALLATRVTVDTINIVLTRKDPPIQLDWAGVTTSITISRDADGPYPIERTEHSDWCSWDIDDGADLWDEICDLSLDWSDVTIRLTVRDDVLAEVLADAEQRSQQ